MIQIEKTEVFGWEAAIRGMRNPMNSWEKSDSYWTHIEDAETKQTARFEFFLGDNDLKLMRSLAKAGDDHGKFLRMIHVQADITAPRYWWTEYDTYKVGTVANSCSTMHKLHEKKFTFDDFSHEKLAGIDDYPITVRFANHDGVLESCSLGNLEITIGILNHYREKFIETKDKYYWDQMVQLLPQSYNQKRTVDLNYQVLAHMYFARRNHKLDEWHEFCAWVEGLPYFREIVVQEEHDGE